MRIIKPTAVAASLILLLSGCGTVNSEAEIDNKGNITSLSFNGEFDKNIFKEYVTQRYVYTPPDAGFYETNPTISAEMSPDLQKFAVFFQEFYLETFMIDTIIPANMTENYLKKACTYDENTFMFTADCHIDVPFIVSLPFSNSLMNGTFNVEEVASIATYEGVLNNFIDVETDLYLSQSFTSQLNLVFPRRVTFASGAGVSSNNNIVTINLVEHNREVINGASNVVRFDVYWEEQLEFWETLWFRIIVFILSIIMITRFILRTFFKRKKVN